MGLCCGRSALPVVDDTGRQHRTLRPKVFVTPVPTLEFDIVAPEGSPSLALNMTRVSGGGGIGSIIGGAACMDQSLHTVSEYSVSSPDPQGQSLSGTLRDEANRSFVTNGLNEVLSGNIDQFVTGVLEMTTSEPVNILEESLYAASTSTLSRTRNSRGIRQGLVTHSLSREQVRYLDAACDMTERMARLVELEQMSRQEIFGAWRMNSALMILAMKRIMPTIRRFRGTPRTRRQKSAQEVLIIHARDIELQMDEEKVKENGVARPGKLNRRHESSEQGPLFSPREEQDMSKRGQPVAEHYQMLALTAREISMTASVQAQVVNDTWDFLSLPEAANHLNTGNVLFRFLCAPVMKLGRDSLFLIDTFINLSSFADEVQENNVPKIDIFSLEEQEKYVTILVKAMYLLPGVRLSNLTVDLLASLDYQRNCQPGINKFEVSDVPNTFRTIKTVIRFVFSVTIQMKVSEINDPEVLNSFKDVDGMVPAKVLLLERTKKNIHKIDSTVKVRSVLLYYPVNDGVLVTNQTILLNSSLPVVVSSLMQTFGSQGATEAAQTAKLTRRYLIRRFGDCRS
ncbi:hypothetical protein C3747_6g387 [Trypanosoma cruzi]|uniref:Uncharacterized protein n=1 Tax=Trypanosoma cruzi TaxID=5693 RepID=A0A2V2XJ41_TRYCR|nr:hypothetical protein C3747_6g387 [Trypanosoma cruzi]